MILVIGGAGQRKLDALLRNTNYNKKEITERLGEDKPVLVHLEKAVKEALLSGMTQEQILAELMWHEAVICREVGCGVVPIDRMEREWRETVGRICCRLAQDADEVVRVFAGIPMVLKGERKWK
ncbi:MAG: bifunctional adenosylcobinamide kinase/adenosylcobinamide-phosphate guanylyltransferase [Clostridia bacterium]|nr:bifunctional adenosylcobinamide kinase/adenosylcobinamide-phosphate guanylyltransferase [Clostridia bacterium]